MPRSAAETRHENYVNATVERINKKYQKYYCNIVHVHEIQEIERYIAEHPKEQKIGFLLQAPPYINQPQHYSPIYFERVGDVESFVQFDSLQAVPYILPESSDSKIHRKQYYSPFSRQVSDKGCMEDAVKILTKCFQEKSMMGFCESNSVRSEEILILTPSEESEFSRLSIKKHKKKEQMEVFRRLLPKVMYHRGKEYLLKHHYKPIENLQKLTSLPARFLTNIENYTTMRLFLEKEPEKFNTLYKENETVLQHIQRKGTLRIHEPGSYLTDPNKMKDIKGQSFFEMSKRYQEKINNPGMKKEEITAIIRAKEKFQNTSTHSLADIQELIHLGINLKDLRDYDGNTPLHILSMDRTAQVSDIRAVIEFGVEINETNRYSKTALQLAVEKNTCEFVQELLRYAPSKPTASVLAIAERVDSLAKPGEALFTPMIKRAMGLTISENEPEIKPQV